MTGQLINDLRDMMLRLGILSFDGDLSIAQRNQLKDARNTIARAIQTLTRPPEAS